MDFQTPDRSSRDQLRDLGHFGRSSQCRGRPGRDGGRPQDLDRRVRQCLSARARHDRPQHRPAAVHRRGRVARHSRAGARSPDRGSCAERDRRPVQSRRFRPGAGPPDSGGSGLPGAGRRLRPRPARPRADGQRPDRRCLRCRAAPARGAPADRRRDQRRPCDPGGDAGGLQPARQRGAQRRLRGIRRRSGRRDSRSDGQRADHLFRGQPGHVPRARVPQGRAAVADARAPGAPGRGQRRRRAPGICRPPGDRFGEPERRRILQIPLGDAAAVEAARHSPFRRQDLRRHPRRARPDGSAGRAGQHGPNRSARPGHRRGGVLARRGPDLRHRRGSPDIRAAQDRRDHRGAPVAAGRGRAGAAQGNRPAPGAARGAGPA